MSAFPPARPPTEEPKKPAKRASRVRPHTFEEDVGIPADYAGRRFCRCGVMGEEGDDRHPTDAPSLSSLVFPPAPEEDASDRIIGEGNVE